MAPMKDQVVSTVAECNTLPNTGEQSSSKEHVYGVRWEPAWQYVWNEHLIQPMRNASFGKVHSDWILPVIHGFIGQSLVEVFGKPLYLTLIARRYVDQQDLTYL